MKRAEETGGHLDDATLQACKALLQEFREATGRLPEDGSGRARPAEDAEAGLLRVLSEGLPSAAQGIMRETLLQPNRTRATRPGAAVAAPFITAPRPPSTASDVSAVAAEMARRRSLVDTGPTSPDRVPDRIVDAAGEGNEAVVLAWMDAAGGQVDATFESGDTGGFTLLMYAVANGQEKLVDLLLGRGAKVNQQASNGMTALMHAVLSNRPPIVRRLLGLGADLKARAANGKTALQFAKEKGFDGCVAAFRQHIERVTSDLRERGSGGVSEGGSKEAATEGAADTSEDGNCEVPLEILHAAGGRGEPTSLANVLEWVDREEGRANATFDASAFLAIASKRRGPGSAAPQGSAARGCTLLTAAARRITCTWQRRC